MMKLLLTAVIALVINIPFGYWRANVKRFSLQWFLAIHVPVVLDIGLRFAFHLGNAWYIYVVMVISYFLGQLLGSLIIKRLRGICDHVTSCLVMDLVRCQRQSFRPDES